MPEWIVEEPTDDGKSPLWLCPPPPPLMLTLSPSPSVSCSLVRGSKNKFSNIALLFASILSYHSSNSCMREETEETNWWKKFFPLTFAVATRFAAALSLDIVVITLLWPSSSIIVNTSSPNSLSSSPSPSSFLLPSRTPPTSFLFPLSTSALLHSLPSLSSLSSSSPSSSSSSSSPSSPQGMFACAGTLLKSAFVLNMNLRRDSLLIFSTFKQRARAAILTMLSRWLKNLMAFSYSGKEPLLSLKNKPSVPSFSKIERVRRKDMYCPTVSSSEKSKSCEMMWFTLLLERR
mmetsp:Transcript_2458/g.5116  ORF Transcript_2458/g.5116 Transcript_2458/m.5116 type:complete len:290 (+) Transcript_2458:1186-2055(+)